MAKRRIGKKEAIRRAQRAGNSPNAWNALLSDLGLSRSNEQPKAIISTKKKLVRNKRTRRRPE